MSFEFNPSEELKTKIEAKRAAKAEKSDARNGEASKQYEKLLLERDGDEDSLIVYPFPYGGAVIMSVPPHEVWARTSKKLVAALVKEGKTQPASTVIAGLIESPGMVLHPQLPELQQWRNELPDLYQELHNAIDARVSNGVSLGK